MTRKSNPASSGVRCSLSLSLSLPPSLPPPSFVILVFCFWKTSLVAVGARWLLSARRACGLRVRFAGSKSGRPPSSSEKFESPSMDRLCRVSGMSAAASIPMSVLDSVDPGSRRTLQARNAIRAPGLVAAAPLIHAPRAASDARRLVHPQCACWHCLCVVRHVAPRAPLEEHAVLLRPHQSAESARRTPPSLPRAAMSADSARITCSRGRLNRIRLRVPIEPEVVVAVASGNAARPKRSPPDLPARRRRGGTRSRRRRTTPSGT